MNSRTVSQLIETATTAWKQSKVPGVQYIPLQTDLDEHAGTFMMRMGPGVVYPRHRHPGGEEILVLKGDLTVADRKLKPGDFLISPPGSIHEASTQQGCMYFAIIPKGIQMMSSTSFDEVEATADVPAGPMMTPEEMIQTGLVDIEKLSEETPPAEPEAPAPTPGTDPAQD